MLLDYSWHALSPWITETSKENKPDLGLYKATLDGSLLQATDPWKSGPLDPWYMHERKRAAVLSFDVVQLDPVSSSVFGSGRGAEGPRNGARSCYIR